MQRRRHAASWRHLDTSKYPLRCSLGEQDHRLRPWRSLLMRPDDRLEAAGAALC
jgi:hypothetical protein